MIFVIICSFELVLMREEICSLCIWRKIVSGGDWLKIVLCIIVEVGVIDKGYYVSLVFYGVFRWLFI